MTSPRDLLRQADSVRALGRSAHHLSAVVLAKRPGWRRRG